MRVVAALLTSYVIAQDLMIIEPEMQLVADWSGQDF
jgi:hypothetical protein